MPDQGGAGVVFRFGSFELTPATAELRKQGRIVRLAHQPSRVLLLLVTRAPEVVTREEIRETTWGSETFIDYRQGINTAIRQIRTALGDTATSPRFLETLPRRGYRFIAPVERIVHEDLMASLEAMLPQAMPAQSDGLFAALAAALILLIALFRRD